MVSVGRRHEGYDVRRGVGGSRPHSLTDGIEGNGAHAASASVGRYLDGSTTVSAHHSILSLVQAVVADRSLQIDADEGVVLVVSQMPLHKRRGLLFKGAKSCRNPKFQTARM